ncbi:hypothetical protein [Streptococcus danieliae]|uniref:hypothetical protein n=1 Tax=Streptococcus danieliae TaxID=747656 RepID=UPI0026EF4F09|nr:hypothetical protein [Streptococcus danieliae]
MDKFFRDFETQLETLKQKIEILKSWHKERGHNGASEITETITSELFEVKDKFEAMAIQYRLEEQSHEKLLQQNIENLLATLEITEYNGDDRNSLTWLLTGRLRKIAKENDSAGRGENIVLYHYLNELVAEDLKKKGVSA